jgi:hypothetical protein
MRLEFFALGGVQGPFEQRAENGGLDLAPVGFGGLVKLADFLAWQGKRRAGLE